jgi:hypothetical protein
MRLLAIACVCLAVTGCGSDDGDGNPSSTGGAAGNGGSSTGGSSGSGGYAGSSTGGSTTGGAPNGGSGGGSGGVTSGKRGIAYGYHSDADLAALSPGIGWWYNWASVPDETLDTGYPDLGVEFVPMVWGKVFDVNVMENTIPKDAKYLLAFNEPNFGNQSNITPEEAAALWPELETFAKSRGMKLVSPAVNYCGGFCNQTDPFVWLEEFFAACTGCQVDYVAMHWYACTEGALTYTLKKYQEKFGKPLWVTEFSCLDEPEHVNDADELSYQAAAVAALEADPMVFRYAWFTGRFEQQPAVNLLGSDGQLTPLGQQYVSLP